MARKDRLKKTLARKLRDLDDHLYLLRESLSKLLAGDEAYLKSLAAELRVLVCMSSGTEGLLWRVLDEVHMDDRVHIHLAGNLNRDHPLARGLQFVYVPVRRAGEGDPRLVPHPHSLKEVIKQCEAVVVSGEGYTHEALIRAVSEQMGSAHEDDGVAPHLIELSGTILSDGPALDNLLASDADLVLEVGERTMSTLAARGDLLRKNRPATSVPSRPPSLLTDRTGDYESSPRALPPEGTAMFLIDHPHPDWRTNAYGYSFGIFVQGALKVRVAKNPDRTMEIWAYGLGSGIAGARSHIPSTDQPGGVMVGLTWSNSDIVFYVCGKRVARLPF